MHINKMQHEKKHEDSFCGYFRRIFFTLVGILAKSRLVHLITTSSSPPTLPLPLNYYVRSYDVYARTWYDRRAKHLEISVPLHKHTPTHTTNQQPRKNTRAHNFVRTSNRHPRSSGTSPRPPCSSPSRPPASSPSEAAEAVSGQHPGRAAALLPHTSTAELPDRLQRAVRAQVGHERPCAAAASPPPRCCSQFRRLSRRCLAQPIGALGGYPGAGRVRWLPADKMRWRARSAAHGGRSGPFSHPERLLSAPAASQKSAQPGACSQKTAIDLSGMPTRPAPANGTIRGPHSAPPIHPKPSQGP